MGDRGITQMRTTPCTPTEALDVRPLSLERWADFERLFGARGACGGCWCMWWRLSRPRFEEGKGEGNRAAMHALLASGECPGLLAYAAHEAVGWCAVAPRDAFPRLDRSRTLARLDDQPVWSVTCLFVAKPWRRRGVSEALLAAACEHARRSGAGILEAYPVEPAKNHVPDVFVFTGLASAFRRQGFNEVARRSPTRPIMRRALQPPGEGGGPGPGLAPVE